jgi:branched-chain amino acid transport system permease protein
VPAELRRERPVLLTYLAIGALIVAFVVTLPLYASEDKVKLAGVIGIFAIIGISLVVLTGWAGQVSLGQMGFVGMAGAFAGTLANKYHWDMGFIFIASGLLGALLMIIVGIPTLRARGLSFAIVTLAFSLAVSSYFLNAGYSPIKGWVPSGGIERTHFLGLFKVDSETRFYFLIMVMLVVTILMVRSLRSSRIGRVMIGVRDNERAAQAYSVSATGALVVAFGISGFIAGMAGALFVLQQRALDASNFDAQQGLIVFSMTEIGGMGSIGGAVIGAAYIKGLQYFLTQPEFALLSTGFGVLFVLYVFRGGIGAGIGDARNGLLRRYARKKNIRVPSLVADTRVDRSIPDDVNIEVALADAVSHADELLEVTE